MYEIEHDAGQRRGRQRGMHTPNVRQILIWAVGALEGLLLARLVLRLFAARPDNPAVAALLALTEPLRAPLALLDAAQPQFGAVLELSTLALLVLFPLGLWAVGRAQRGAAGWRRS